MHVVTASFLLIQMAHARTSVSRINWGVIVFLIGRFYFLVAQKKAVIFVPCAFVCVFVTCLSLVLGGYGECSHKTAINFLLCYGECSLILIVVLNDDTHKQVHTKHTH